MRAPNSGTPAFVVSNIHVVGMVCLGNDNGRSNDRFPYRRSARPRFPSHRVPVIYGSTSFPELLVLQGGSMRAPNSGTPAFVVSNIHVVGMVCLGNDNGRSNDRFPYRRSARPRFPSHRVPVIYGSTSFPELLVLQGGKFSNDFSRACTGACV